MPGVFQRRGFLLIFTQRRTNLKTSKGLVKPSLNKIEWVRDWSDDKQFYKLVTGR